MPSPRSGLRFAGAIPALATLGWLLLAGCTDRIDHGARPCAQSCSGCCNTLGECVSGDSLYACGAGGVSCDVCGATDQCLDGACQGSVADVVEIDPDAGTSLTACGPSSCGGCCSGDVCVGFFAQTASSCGAGGAACAACSAGLRCEAGACQAPPACDLRTSVSGGRSLDFGQTGVGFVSPLNVELWNAGAGNCQITAPVWDSSADRNAFNFGAQMTSSVLGPGERARVPVTFSPWAVKAWGESSNAFTFMADDGAASTCGSGVPGCRRVKVTGEGIASGLQPSAPLVPSRVDFGAVQIGCESRWRDVLLVNENSNTTPLELTSVSVTGSGFELGSLELPQQIPAWGTATLRVRFAPTEAGPSSGTLTVTLGEKLTSIPLDATGTTASGRTETFLQTEKAFADVLFVIHDGPPYDSLQTALADGGVTFVQEAQKAGGAYRLGVITSDATQGSAGRLQGSPRFVTSDLAQPAEAFARNVKVGLQMAENQSLETTRLALLPLMATDPLQNGGFLRPGARLAVVAIGDAVEKSVAPPEDYARAVAASIGERPQSERVRAWTITGTCQSGTQYFEFAKRVGGGCISLSGTTLQSALQTVAQDVFATRHDFTLQEPIGDPLSVAVTVNGYPLSTEYTVDTSKNAVHFVSGYDVEPGQKVDVTYAPACHP